MELTRGPGWTTDEVIAALWAKTDRKTGGPAWHPLLCHLIDVAAVAEVLWEGMVPAWTRRGIALGLGVDEDSAGRWVAFWAGLHDLGKCSPAFQGSNAAGRARIEAAGISCVVVGGQAKHPHAAISARTLPALLIEDFELPEELARTVAGILGGHHGAFANAALRKHVRPGAGKADWEAARRALAAALGDVLGIRSAPVPARIVPAQAMLLAGLVSVADWIGSDADLFPLAAKDERAPVIDPVGYLAMARAQAQDAMAHLGWSRLPVDTDDPPRPFTDLFPHISTPNDLQARVMALSETETGPSLTIVEAPTGEGKTETALYLADRHGRRAGRGGAYVALPTRGTGDQMLGRVRRFLERRYAGGRVDLQLLHGQAILCSEFAELRELAERRLEPGGVGGDGGYDKAPAAVVAGGWFGQRKRGLLAPFGVGTVDQTLLAVLQTRHYFVRLCGLAGKTVVIDEVHAYDTYMSTLLDTLLTWLAALGSPVVLLSATLPAGRRQELAAAYAAGLGRAAPDLPDAGYPRLTWVSAAGDGAAEFGTSLRSRKEVAVTWIDGAVPEPGTGGAFLLGERLQGALAGGGCAAVMCTTVARAQQVFAALLPYFPDEAVFPEGGGDGGAALDLLHARFLAKDRAIREGRVVGRFGTQLAPGEAAGPDAVSRPWRAVVVATQVIEQSLDLDFDLLVTDLAPVDLILQRLGRLFRHQRTNRASAFTRPEVWICDPPPDADGLPVFDTRDEFVYAPHLLLRSWLALRSLLAWRDRSALAIPADVEPLIAAVYDNVPCPDDARPTLRVRWDATYRDLCKQRDDHRDKASKALILPPAYRGDLFEDRNLELEEENPALHPTLQALTRLSEPSVAVVCLDPGVRERLVPRGTPTTAEAIALLRHAVTIGSPYEAVRALIAQETPPGWEKSALLRHHRLVELDDDGGAPVGTRRLVRNSLLGIVVT